MIKEPFGISDACNKKILLPLLFIIHFGFIASHLQSVKIFSEGAHFFTKFFNQGNLSKGLIRVMYLRVLRRKPTEFEWNLHCKSF